MRGARGRSGAWSRQEQVLESKETSCLSSRDLEAATLRPYYLSRLPFLSSLVSERGLTPASWSTWIAAVAFAWRASSSAFLPHLSRALKSAPLSNNGRRLQG